MTARGGDRGKRELALAEITVGIGNRAYPIVIGRGILRCTADYLPAGRRYSSAAVLTHPALSDYAETVSRSLESAGIRTATITIPSGERSKSLPSLSSLYGKLVRAGLDRGSLIVTVGGGV